MMSAFYIVLIVFLIVIGLLCLVSCLVYFCHICDRDDGEEEKGFPFTPRKNAYDPAEQELINKTQTSGLDENSMIELESVNVRDRANIYETQQQNSWGGEPSVKRNSSLPGDIVKARQQRLCSSSENVSVLDRSKKPLIAVKPTIHSLPSSKRNSLVRPTDAPPPPPPQICVEPLEIKSVLTKSSSIVKPKAPPPVPPPSKADPPPFKAAPPPPSYQDVVYDTPDDYLNNK